MSGLATAVLDQALAYASAAWPAFPTRPDDPSCPGGRDCECKRPFPGTHGCLDASTDPAVIRAWWRPDVLDVDVKPDGDGWAAFSYRSPFLSHQVSGCRARACRNSRRWHAIGTVGGLDSAPVHSAGGWADGHGRGHEQITVPRQVRTRCAPFPSMPRLL
jgi:Bifunctional DNA primase/polymerase, N-terminal